MERTTHHWLGDERGFSLLEVLLAAVLVTVIALGVGLSFPLMTRQQGDDTKRTLVIHAVHDRLHLIEQMPYASVFTTAPADFSAGTNCECTGDTPAFAQNFDRQASHFAPIKTTLSGVEITLRTCVSEINAAGASVCPGNPETGLKSIVVRAEIQSGGDIKVLSAVSNVSSPEPASVLSGAGHLQGTVNTLENPAATLANITVRAVDATGALAAVAWTNNLGAYSLDHLASGAYVVSLLLSNSDETIAFPVQGFYAGVTPNATGLHFTVRNSDVPLQVVAAAGTIVFASAVAQTGPPAILSPNALSAAPVFMAVAGENTQALIPLPASVTSSYHVYCVNPAHVFSEIALVGPPGPPVLPGTSWARTCP